MTQGNALSVPRLSGWRRHVVTGEPDAGAAPVAIVNRALISSGTVLKSIEIATALRDTGVPVELWTMDATGTARARVPAGIAVVEIGGGAGRTFGLAGQALALAQTVRVRKPGVLLSGGKHFHLPALAGLILSGRRTRTAFGGRASNSSHRPGRSPLRRMVDGLFYRAKYAWMDFAVAVSGEIAGELAAKLGPRGPRLVTIPNGVDRGRVDALSRDAEPHRWLDDPALDVLVGMGRIDHQKGFDLLIEAMARLPDHPQLRLMVIGGGDPAKLRDYAARLGLGDRVEFTGYQANPFGLLARARCFVLPSRWEGASNALTEALALGLPLIATRCAAGSREILADGGNGSLAHRAEPEALAEAIRHELAIARDREAQRQAAARYDIAQCMAAYVELLANWRAAGLKRRGRVSKA